MTCIKRPHATATTACVAMLVSLTTMAPAGATTPYKDAGANAYAGGPWVHDRQVVTQSVVPAEAAARQANGSGADPGGPSYTEKAEAVSRTGTGFISTRVLASFMGTGYSSDRAMADVYGDWGDTVTFTAPGMNGRTGVWTGTISVTGSYELNTQLGDPSGKGGLVLSLDTPGGAGPLQLPGFQDRCGEILNCYVFAPTTGTSFVSWTVPVSLGFTYGQPVDFHVQMNLYANADGSRTRNVGVSVAADFSHTLAWQGTTAVLDDAGQALSSYTLVAASGVNYAYAAADPRFGGVPEVPEPASAALLLMGIGAGLLQRQRGSRRWRGLAAR